MDSRILYDLDTILGAFRDFGLETDKRKLRKVIRENGLKVGGYGGKTYVSEDSLVVLARNFDISAPSDEIKEAVGEIYYLDHFDKPPRTDFYGLKA